MDLVITLLIVIGALNTAANIVRYHRFLVSSQDMLSSGKKSDRLKNLPDPFRIIPVS